MTRKYALNIDITQAGVLAYGDDFLDQFAAVQGYDKNGAFITSCICHGCPWTDLSLDGKLAYDHYADWYYGATTGADAIHIDHRLPNGNGTLTNSECMAPF